MVYVLAGHCLSCRHGASNQGSPEAANAVSFTPPKLVQGEGLILYDAHVNLREGSSFHVVSYPDLTRGRGKVWVRDYLSRGVNNGCDHYSWGIRIVYSGNILRQFGRVPTQPATSSLLPACLPVV